MKLAMISALAVLIATPALAGKSELVDCTTETLVKRGTIGSTNYSALPARDTIGWVNPFEGQTWSKGVYRTTCTTCGKDPVVTTHYGNKGKGRGNGGGNGTGNEGGGNGPNKK